jgi:hypothetical protein
VRIFALLVFVGLIAKEHNYLHEALMQKHWNQVGNNGNVNRIVEAEFKGDRR